MNVKHTNAPEFEAMVGQRLLNAPDQRAECLDLIQTVIRANWKATRQATGRTTGQPAHSSLDPSYILTEAMLQLSSQVHLDWGLSKGDVKLEITTQEEALRLAPTLMPTIQELVREDLPEELQDRLLDEMNRRAERALSEIPQGEYAALAEATLKRIHQGDSTNLDLETAGTPNSPDDGKPVNEHSFRLLISNIDGDATALLVCLKCQKVLMDTGPGFDTETPEGLRCDHTNSTTLSVYLGEDRTDDLEP